MGRDAGLNGFKILLTTATVRIISNFQSLSTSTNKIQIAINAMKSNSGIVGRAIKTMGWSIVAYPKVLALVGVLGNTRKGFIF
jgi:hypothetical protein